MNLSVAQIGDGSTLGTSRVPVRDHGALRVSYVRVLLCLDRLHNGNKLIKVKNQSRRDHHESKDMNLIRKFNF